MTSYPAQAAVSGLYDRNILPRGYFTLDFCTDLGGKIKALKVSKVKLTFGTCYRFHPFSPFLLNNMFQHLQAPLPSPHDLLSTPTVTILKQNNSCEFKRKRRIH